MITTRHILSCLTVTMMASMPLLAQAQDRFTSAASRGYCLTNSGGSATIQGCSTSNPGQAISMPYAGGTNEFYGQLKINGQCLDAAGASLRFASCASGPAQIWKMSGNTGMINNGAGNCVGVRSGSLTTWPCNQGGAGLTWWNNSRAKVIAVNNMKSVPTGTKLSVMNGNIVAGGAGNVIAAGAGNLVARGTQSIIAGGAGNIVAGGAGN